MRYKYPNYYKKFRCIAQSCEATCCAGWEIVIDEESIEKYLEIKTDFGNRLCNSIDFEEGIFHQDNKKRCAFLNEENLCDIYTELGEEALCYTCTQYPRHIEEFEDVNEVSLSISCPEVAKMILGCEEKITFYEEDIEEEVEEFEDFDFLFYEILYDAREVLFEILQNRQRKIEERIAIAYAMCREIQQKIDDYDTFAIEDVLEKYEKIDTVALTEPKQHYEKIQAYLMDLYRLEVLQEEWRPYLLNCQTRLYEISYEEYEGKREAFQKEYHTVLERMKEQLMVYFIYSYFCGAVYDGEVWSKYLLAHLTTQIVEELWFAKYLENQGVISEEEMHRITYRYAREIEHSDQNLEILEEIYHEY